jgi:hypothetical protein
MSGATPSRSHPPKGHHLGGQSDGLAQYEHLGSMIGNLRRALPDYDRWA